MTATLYEAMEIARRAMTAYERDGSLSNLLMLSAVTASLASEVAAEAGRQAAAEMAEEPEQSRRLRVVR